MAQNAEERKEFELFMVKEFAIENLYFLAAVSEFKRLFPQDLFDAAYDAIFLLLLDDFFRRFRLSRVQSQVRSVQLQNSTMV
jgi:hypothetical protein